MQQWLDFVADMVVVIVGLPIAALVVAMGLVVIGRAIVVAVQAIARAIARVTR